ncbi:MAG TPA: hypothetical protein VMP01_00235 [Pirellulaceae bacterium]|nr:hypothetical protein [Pirellulaceae bacterium]
MIAKGPQTTLAELSERAIRLLCRELGVADAIRFLSQYRRGSGDYTRDRDQLFKQKTVAELVADIKEWKSGEGG